MQALAADKGLKAEEMDEAAGTHALATGSILLLAVAQPDGVVYKYDDTNPDARLARLLADRALKSQPGGAIRCKLRTARPRDRLALHRLCGAGAAGNEPDGLGDVGPGICHCRGAAEETAEAHGGFAHAALAVSGGVSAFAPGHAGRLRWWCFLGFAWLVFGVPFRGPLWELGLLCVLTSLVFSALGLLVASRAKTMEAVSGLMNLVMLPMWILSGVFFSATRFPAVIQPIVRALPLTAAIDAMRGNMLQGMRLGQMMAPVGILLVWLVAPFAVSLRIFRWR